MLTEEERQEALALHKAKAGNAGLTEEEKAEARSLHETKQKQATRSETRGQRVDRGRKETADGMRLRPFGVDTDVELPQWAAEGLAGMGRRFAEIGTLGTHKSDPKVAEQLNASGPAMVGGIAADMAAMSPLGAAGAVGRAVSAPKTIAQAAGGGAAYGAATSSDRVTGAVGGGLGGAVGQGVVGGIAKAVSPRARDGARELAKDGVPLTVGQTMGGAAQRVEDTVAGVPFIGDPIIGARRRSLEGYNRKVLDDALAPIGETVDPRVPVGRDAIQVAQDKVRAGYNEVLDGLDLRLDDLFLEQTAELETLVQKLPKAERIAFRNEADEILEAMSNESETMLGQTFKEADSNLRWTYKKALKSDDPNKERLGKALRQLHANMMGMVRRQHPDRAPRLDALDQSYAKLSVVEDAANFEGAKEGMFTPSHLWRAGKKRTDRKRLAAGKGFDQRDTEAAKNIFGQTIPDSGTAGRMIASGALGVGGTAFAPRAVLPAYAASAAMYSSPGQKLLRTLLLERGEGQTAETIREALEKAAQYSGRFGTATGVN